MSSWTPEQHADARVWANERGAKSRALAGALDEIERLQERSMPWYNEDGDSIVFTGSDDDTIGVWISDYLTLYLSARTREFVGLKIDNVAALLKQGQGKYPPLLMWKGGQRPKGA